MELQFHFIQTLLKDHALNWWTTHKQKTLNVFNTLMWGAIQIIVEWNFHITTPSPQGQHGTLGIITKWKAQVPCKIHVGVHIKGWKCGFQTLSSLGRQCRRNKFNLFLLPKKTTIIYWLYYNYSSKNNDFMPIKKERDKVCHLGIYTYHRKPLW
jgi:hypothetical protein